MKAETVTLCLDGDCSQAAFAASDIKDALASRKFQTERVGLAVENGNPGEARQRIVLCLESNKTWLGALRASGAQLPRTLEAEGFGIRVTKTKPLTTYWVIGVHPGGLMYGGLELAEIIRAAGLAGVKRVDQRPYMAWRGTKFNLPLDARTPTYTEPSDSAQRNIPEMWSVEFWRGYIDNLARFRYNSVSLWSLHPLPSMVGVPDYPDIALHDVKRSTVEWKEYYDLSGRGFDAPEILGNLETVKRMTIDEQITFWRKVMRYAKDRNVDFYVITWNIFVNGTDGKYGITDGIGNPVTADYFRETDELEDYSQAEDDLRRAAKWWKRYVSIASSKYKNPIWMNRVGYVDLGMLTKEVKRTSTLPGRLNRSRKRDLPPPLSAPFPSARRRWATA